MRGAKLEWLEREKKRAAAGGEWTTDGGEDKDVVSIGPKVEKKRGGEESNGC